MLVDTENVTLKGYIDPNDHTRLWLIVEDVRNWSISVYKDWLYFIYELREVAYEKGITDLMVGVTDSKMQKFAEMLGFEVDSHTDTHTVLRQVTDVYRG